jgi:hypothetical protein
MSEHSAEKDVPRSSHAAQNVNNENRPARRMTGLWRVDRLVSGNVIETTWFGGESAAVAEADRLRRAGVNYVVAWFDVQGGAA